MNRISIISDRPDYHSVLVRDGSDLVELAGKRPWLTLFKAIVRLKVKKLKRRIRHGTITTGETNHTHPLASILPLHGYDQSTQSFHFPHIEVTAAIRRKPQGLLLIQGETVDELSATSGASRKTCGTQEEKGTGRPGDQESDREPAA
jgi:hypothetical protein